MLSRSFVVSNDDNFAIFQATVDAFAQSEQMFNGYIASPDYSQASGDGVDCWKKELRA